MIDQLLAAASHGLDPRDYDAWTLDSAARRRGPAGAPALELPRVDSMLTRSMLRYLADLHGGRARLSPFARPSTDDVDWVEALRQGIAGDSIPGLVKSSEPRLTQYRNLRLQLARYRRLAADSAMPLLPDGPVVRPGDEYPSAGTLRRRLRLEGDLNPEGEAAPSAARYDESLAAGVRRFQLRHGLAPDGLLGPQTLVALNTPLAYRVHQIELALERLRWLPRLGAQPFVVVNIPAFQLFAFDSAGGAGTPTLTTNVVVGRALATRTPMLFEQMRYVEFRPYWNVPQSILTAEILPVLRRNPDFLRAHRMEVVGAGGQALGDKVTPNILSGLSRGVLSLRQKPGPSNALGLIKFAFPNAAAVYMHGTPESGLFAQTRRDFSHGCIRIEDPAALAAWVLHDQPEWNPDRIAGAMNDPETRRVSLVRPIPVAVFYTTVVATPEGQTLFYPDIYGQDRRLDDLLHDAIPAPRGVAAAAPAG